MVVERYPQTVRAMSGPSSIEYSYIDDPHASRTRHPHNRHLWITRTITKPVDNPCSILSSGLPQAAPHVSSALGSDAPHREALYYFGKHCTSYYPVQCRAIQCNAVLSSALLTLLAQCSFIAPHAPGPLPSPRPGAPHRAGPAGRDVRNIDGRIDEQCCRQCLRQHARRATR